MIDCSKEITRFHDEEVNLPGDVRRSMKSKRDANRARLDAGLSAAGHETPKEYVSQGSYAMRTMIQDEENDIDIDDGAYFTKEAFIDSFGTSLNPYMVRKRIADALTDERFNKEPEVKDNCVRVKYSEGYQVDVPVYRSAEETVNGEVRKFYELASGDEWRRSDPRGVTRWFKNANKDLSPDGEQMRRIVRLLKEFVFAYPEWAGHAPSGFMISALTVERYVAIDGRDDEALYMTMVRILDRLKEENGLELDHPVPEIEDKLTSGPFDRRMTALRTSLEGAIKKLDKLHDASDASEALEIWGDAFNRPDTFKKYASERNAEGDANSETTVKSWSKSETPSPVRKPDRDRRYG